MPGGQAVTQYGAPLPEAICDDCIDNDCDGLVDCDDLSDCICDGTLYGAPWS